MVDAGNPRERSHDKPVELGFIADDHVRSPLEQALGILQQSASVNAGKQLGSEPARKLPRGEVSNIWIEGRPRPPRVARVDSRRNVFEPATRDDPRERRGSCDRNLWPPSTNASASGTIGRGCPNSGIAVNSTRTARSIAHRCTLHANTRSARPKPAGATKRRRVAAPRERLRCRRGAVSEPRH
jgi:hypothetical protein